MNLVSANEHGVVFGVHSGERELFERTLERYPVIPGARAPLTREGSEEDLAEAQEMLETLTREAKAENVRRVADFLRKPRQFEAKDGVLRLNVARGELNWLLEIVNEIRVGVWSRLGEPDPGNIPFNTSNIEDWIAMEYCAEIQMNLLEVLNAG